MIDIPSFSACILYAAACIQKLYQNSTKRER